MTPIETLIAVVALYGLLFVEHRAAVRDAADPVG